MRTLIIGSGGREHALAYQLSKEHEVICAPGNPGIAQDVETRPISISDGPELVKLGKSIDADLVVVGPEDPLVLGLADTLRGSDLVVYGPGLEGARLEGSKDFSKKLMAGANVPTAEFASFSDFKSATAYARSSYDRGIRLAVKVDGTAAGKGVAICHSFEEAEAALRAAMVEKVFGVSGEVVVLEELLVGREFSLLTVVGDQNYFSLPVAQDHKRAFDNDEGPNTGGMGTFSPCPWVSDSLVRSVEETMVSPILAKLKELGVPYRGTLFTGIMATPQGPKCLEYNVRFGDPEIQSIVMRIDGGFGEALFAAATGAFIEPIKISSKAAVSVIVASRGYPGTYETRKPIRVTESLPDTKIFYAGVAAGDAGMVTSGGRVLAASATGDTVEEARALAYRAAETVQFDGAFYRTDIALTSGD